MVNSHFLNFKNALRVQLTDDCEIPFEARKANQMLLSVKKQINTKTGYLIMMIIVCRETRYMVKDLRQVDYEFECEGLADFKYGIVPNKETNKELEESLVRALEKNDG